MHFSSVFGIFFIILAFFVCKGADNVDATFWDGCAGVSQVKSILQLMAGHRDDAIQTQKNFLNQMIIVSQMKSIIHLINKDYKAAKKTQKTFYKEMVEPLLDCTPAIGHMKACIHLIFSDTDRALDILKEATRSTAIFIGAGVSGPTAAYIAGVIADVVFTSIDSYKAKQFLPYGTIEYLRHFREASFSEHFDMLADMAFIGEGGQIYSNYRVTQQKTPFTQLPSEVPRVGLLKGFLKEQQPKKWYRKRLGGGSRSRRKKMHAKLKNQMMLDKKRKNKQ